MTVWILVGVIVVLVAINICLWKFGFVQDAEKPVAVDDKPVMDPRQRKAILLRLNRWKEEGKLTRAEFERVSELCELDWG